MPNSVYIHIPFCKQKCKYCSFVSYTSLDRISEYVQLLLKDISENYNSEELKTLYFGGGTPSLLPVNGLATIIKKFNLNPNCEVTFELNPDDANLEYLKKIHELGINRLSIGSQTFNDKILSLIGRRHNSEQTREAVFSAQKAGFKNISLDLIYGLPEQNLDLLHKDLEIISTIGIQHISTYGLKIEENSYWGKICPKNIPDDDTQADMYLSINKFLESRGFNRYEISNFSLNGFESKHNLNYWNNEEYYGFGIAAHGYANNIRYSKPTSYEEYKKSPIKYHKDHIQTKDEQLEEEIFLGFRKEAGIDIKIIKTKFGINFEEKYKNILKKYMPKYIEKTVNGYKLTLEGILLSNIILADFIS